MSEKLEYELNVKKNELSPALDQASKKSSILENALTTALGVFGGGVALKGFDLLASKMNDAIAFAKESVAAYSEQEDALNRLGQALRASGDSSKQSVDDLASFADELERTSRESGEAIIAQLAYTKSLGASNDATKQIVQAAANLSATFGGSLETNVALLGKTLQGTSGKLANLVPELRSLTAEQLKAGDAAEIINSKFAGAAASQIDTYSGRINRLGNAYEDVQKQIGGLIANNSLLNSALELITEAFDEATQKISDYRIEQERSKNGFQESEESLTQLSREYENLTEKIEALQSKGDALPGGLDSLDTSRLQLFSKQLAALETQINNAAIEVKVNDIKAALNNATEGGKTEVVDQEILNARAKLNEEILNLDRQLALEKQNILEESANATIENDLIRQQEELQRITDFSIAKAELDFQLREQEIIRLQEGEDEKLALRKLYGEKELALEKIKNDSRIKSLNATREAERKSSAERIALQQATASTITGIVGAAANLSVLLTREGSKEQFYIQKAAALAQAIVATNLAMAMANTVPPPGNIAAIAAAKANGAIAISGIVASTLKGFQEGGIIGGEGQGATNGPDNTIFKGRKGEMVLTAEDQSMLLNGIRNGSLGGGGDIVIQIGEEVVFRAVRNQIKKGYKLS
jgi:hypothetical protein